MKTKQYLTILLLLILYSCSNKKKSVLEKTKSDNENIMELKRKCVQEGDIQSFDELVLYYSYHEKLEYELLPIAIIMADTYHAGLAPYKSDFLIYVVANIQKLFISLPCKEQTTGEFYTDV
ncbi:hypothetical protein [Flavobacterium branchiophilum]|uniref:Lipoprotein n=1 Tax=Flavobacterium branchiophilum TaxID=55197 RepID=A0A543G074_9FLAO|nr:hypothetical protein [Flavobacterium branchiophilum]TQM39486.1 hypothetical protein BC670_0284 [Flavobacterium branchiophilum]